MSVKKKLGKLPEYRNLEILHRLPKTLGWFFLSWKQMRYRTVKLSYLSLKIKIKPKQEAKARKCTQKHTLLYMYIGMHICVSICTHTHTVQLLHTSKLFSWYYWGFLTRNFQQWTFSAQKVMRVSCNTDSYLSLKYCSNSDMNIRKQVSCYSNKDI